MESNDTGPVLSCVALSTLLNLSEPQEMESEDVKSPQLEKRRRASAQGCGVTEHPT